MPRAVSIDVILLLWGAAFSNDAPTVVAEPASSTLNGVLEESQAELRHIVSRLDTQQGELDGMTRTMRRLRMLRPRTTRKLGKGTSVVAVLATPSAVVAPAKMVTKPSSQGVAPTKLTNKVDMGVRAMRHEIRTTEGVHHAPRTIDELFGDEPADLQDLEPRVDSSQAQLSDLARLPIRNVNPRGMDLQAHQEQILQHLGGSSLLGIERRRERSDQYEQQPGRHRDPWWMEPAHEVGPRYYLAGGKPDPLAVPHTRYQAFPPGFMPAVEKRALAAAAGGQAYPQPPPMMAPPPQPSPPASTQSSPPAKPVVQPVPSPQQEAASRKPISSQQEAAAQQPPLPPPAPPPPAAVEALPKTPLVEAPPTSPLVAQQPLQDQSAPPQFFAPPPPGAVATAPAPA